MGMALMAAASSSSATTLTPFALRNSWMPMARFLECFLLVLGKRAIIIALQTLLKRLRKRIERQFAWQWLLGSGQFLAIDLCCCHVRETSRECQNLTRGHVGSG